MWRLLDSFLYEHTQFGENKFMCYLKIKNMFCFAIRHYKFCNFFIISMTSQITISRIMFSDFVNSEFPNANWS